MKLGVIFEAAATGNAARDKPADALDALLELAVTAETEGFASAWVDGCDFVLAAAVAEVTDYIRVGVLTRPAIEHPVRIAENAAVFDLLSNGRLLFGADPVVSPEELAACAVPGDQSRPRFIEAMDVVVKSWTHDGFAYLGEHNRIPLCSRAVAVAGQPFVPEPIEPPFVVPWRRAGMPIDYVSLQPKPLQVPHPPVFVAADDEQTAGWAARAGHSLLIEGSGAGGLPAHVLAEAYWSELQQAGRQREEVTLAVALDVDVFEDGEKSGRRRPISEAGGLSGTPEQVLLGIKAVARDTGAFHLLCRIVAGDGQQEAAARRLHLLASEVRPRLEM